MGLGLLKAAHHLGLIPVVARVSVDADDRVPVFGLAPGDSGVPGRVVELAIELIDFRLKFSDSPLQSYGFSRRR